MYDIIKLDRHDDALRASFNRLAEATFGLNFEGWYQNGFWGDNYAPYCAVEDGQVLANVSVNRTDLQVDGQTYRIRQLGTVMTAESHRNQGLIRAIMGRVQQELADADGVYLFANDEVLDFYPKFGFARDTEYVHTKAVSQTTARTAVPVPMDGPADWAVLQQAMDRSAVQSACTMVDNPGLIFFYASQFLKDNVFYLPALDAHVIAEEEDGSLLLHQIFCPEAVSIDAVTAAFGADITQVTLGFTPQDPSGFTAEELHEEDTTFFVQGDFFRNFGAKRLRIPTLSHA